jgi:hypothetical protein
MISKACFASSGNFGYWKFFKSLRFGCVHISIS